MTLFKNENLNFKKKILRTHRKNEYLIICDVRYKIIERSPRQKNHLNKFFE